MDQEQQQEPPELSLGNGGAAAQDPGDGTDPPEPKEPQAKANRLGRRPSSTKKVYMGLAQLVGDETHVGFIEVGWYRGHGHDHVKRQIAEDARNGHLEDVQDAIEGKGAVLRAVPAESWPKTEATKYERPEPKLRIG